MFFTPHLKRKKGSNNKWLVKPFPNIENDKKYEGIFTGICVEICSRDAIIAIYDNGFYGKGSQSRSTPQVVMQGASSSTEVWKNENGVDESLSLSLEEAFFLANYLNVLKILDLKGEEMGYIQFLDECLKVNEIFIESLASYLYLKSKGWIVKSGLKFGGNYCDDAGGNESYNITTLDRLHVQLFTNYDKTAHPMATPTQRTNTTIFLSIGYVDIDELNGKMTLHGWINIRWKDGGRTWRPEYFDNITTLHLRSREIWKPDITLLNSAGKEGDYMGDTQALLLSDGSFLWVPQVVYTAYCNLNLKLWPYDTQTCKLKIGTWTMTNIFPKFLETNETLEYSDLIKSTEWDINDAKAEYVTKDFYNYLEYTFKLQRRSSMYSAVIFTPASCIILLCLSTFWLPPQMGEKILLNGIVIVVVAAFLMYFAQMLPILAENTPLVVLFYSSSLLMLSLSTIISVIVLYLSTAKHKKRVPEFLKNLLNGVVGQVLLLSQFTLEAEPQSLLNNGTKELGEHVYDNPDQSETPDPTHVNPSLSSSSRFTQFDWVLLATAFDRICFLIYCILFMILAIVYSV